MGAEHMEVSGAILRIITVCTVAFGLSLLAMLSSRWIGVDIKAHQSRFHPAFLAVAGFFNILFIVATAIILGVWDHQSMQVLGFGLNTKEAGYALLVLFLNLIMGMGYASYLMNTGWIEFSYDTEKVNLHLKPGTAALGYVVLFVAALQEEVLFRGFLAYVLLPFGFYKALVISAIVFTFWHFLTNKVSLLQTIDWMLGGLVLFYVYWASGSIWVSAIVHFARNLTNVLVFNIAGTGLFTFQKPLTPQQKTIYTLLMSLMIFVLARLFFGVGS